MSEDAGQDLSVSAEETADDERPSLRIESLEIDDLRSIKRLRWPEDGFGWNGRIPDIVVVGGANGSGKTTLLEEIFNTTQTIINLKEQSKNWLNRPLNYQKLRLVIPNEKIKIELSSKKILINLEQNLSNAAVGLSSLTKEKLVYFKSKRTNSEFSRGRKDVENIREASAQTYTWDGAGSSDISIEKLLYSARWEDANAMFSGRMDKATKFNFYADEFERFTEGEKKLVWTDEGVLLVETRDGVRHDVNEMSSGEHQALIFSIMLSRWWTPGSLILIDEPELHLHTHWQAKLLQRIIDLQKERGGQAILATQSSDLFSMAPRGSRVILGVWGDDDGR
jgi:predicted ATPase